jgi:hypothetical protein
MRLQCVIVGMLLVLGSAVPVWALDEISQEESVADLLATPLATEEEEETAGRRWGLIPQVGYGPDTGPVGGLKYTHRNLADLGITFDLDGTYALEQQQGYAVGIGTPHLFDDKALVFFRGRYKIDPQREFFGLGNNDIGPDPASTFLREQYDFYLTAGWRPVRRLALNFSVGLRNVRIGKGKRDDDFPFTVDASPDLPGIDGGFINPFELSLVYTTRDSVMRPLGRRHTIGARLDGGFIQGPESDIPFWELEELGGDDTLRGFFPQRFRGSQRVLLNLEYDYEIGSFNFFDIWRVTVGAAAFGETGRVFISRDELTDEFKLDNDLVSRVVNHLQYSYGGGLRFMLSEAIVARVDVAFSDEETGLVYLSFGHAF